MKPVVLAVLIAIALSCTALAGCSYVAFALLAWQSPVSVSTQVQGEAVQVPQSVVMPNPGTIKTVSFKNIGFRYDSALAKDVKSQAVPGMTEPFVPFDSYQFTFDGYVVDSPVQPRLWVFATNLIPEGDNRRLGVSALQRSLADRTDPGKTLPVYLTGPSANGLQLPAFVPVNARPILSTQWSTVQGAGASGLRFVTVYAQGPSPVDPDTLIYSYSGLTPDGKVAFAAAFPVRPAARLNMTTDTKALLGDLAKIDTFNQQLAEQIARLSPSDFVPDLSSIDQVMSSLTVSGALPIIAEKSPNQIVAEKCVRNGFSNEVNPADGYCFLYPSRFRRQDLGNGRFDIVGPSLDTSPDPLRAALGIDIQPALGKTLAQAVDAYLKDNTVPTLKTVQTNLALNGEPAVMLEPLAGRPTFRAVLAVHGDKLLILRFSPDASGFPRAKPDMTELYQTVVESFTFLP